MRQYKEEDLILSKFPKPKAEIFQKNYYER